MSLPSESPWQKGFGHGFAGRELPPAPDHWTDRSKTMYANGHREGAMRGKTILMFTQAEYDAVLTGLRLLSWSLERGDVDPADNHFGQVLTNAGEHAGLTAGQIEDLCGDMQSGRKDFSPYT